MKQNLAYVKLLAIFCIFLFSCKKDLHTLKQVPIRTIVAESIEDSAFAQKSTKVQPSGLETQPFAPPGLDAYLNAGFPQLFCTTVIFYRQK